MCRLKHRWWNLKRSVWSLIIWFPIIWKDRDWDMYFLYRILHRKIYNMEKYMASDRALGINSVKESKRLRKVRLVLERLIKDDYLNNALTNHNEVYKKDYENLFKNWVKNDDGTWSLIDINPSKERDTSFCKCRDHSYYMKEQDIDFLFDTMKNYGYYWWD